MSTKVKLKKFEEEIEIPQGIQADIVDRTIKMKSEKGEIQRELSSPLVKLTKKENKLFLFTEKGTKKEKMMLRTLRAHINNMIKGLKEDYVYELKICSGHFPMSVAVQGDEVLVKNFLGEKVPRVAKILPGVKVEVKGDLISVTGSNKETVGQTSANIEIATKIKNRDRRVFQDGIFITSKAGKEIK